VRLLAKLVRAPEERSLCHIGLAHLELAHGRYDAAREELAAAAGARPDDGDPAWALELRALFAVLPFVPVERDELLSVRDELLRWDASGVAPRRNQVLAVHNGHHAILREHLIGLVSARLGDADRGMAAAIALDHAEHSSSQRGFAALLAGSVRASVAAAGGRADDALAILEGRRVDLWYQHTVTSPFFSCAYDRYLRAELLRRCGRADEAARWYATLGESSPYDLIFLAPAHLRQAQLREEAGDSALAALHYARCARLWKNSDTRFAPVVAEAKERAEALKGRG
jgi:hypothetical protein